MKKYIIAICLLLSTPVVSKQLPPDSPSEDEIISSLAEKLAKDVSWSHEHALRKLGRENVISYHGCFMSCVNTNVHGYLLYHGFCDRVCGISAKSGAMRDAVYYEDTNHIFPSRNNKRLKQIIKDNMQYMYLASYSNVQVEENGHYDVDTGEVVYHIYPYHLKNNPLR